jgi:hypothetical protein
MFLSEVNHTRTRRVAAPPRPSKGDRGLQPCPPCRAVSPKHRSRPTRKVRGLELTSPIRQLDQDPKALFLVAAKAQAAVDHLAAYSETAADNDEVAA